MNDNDNGNDKKKKKIKISNKKKKEKKKLQDSFVEVKQQRLINQTRPKFQSKASSHRHFGGEMSK